MTTVKYTFYGRYENTKTFEVYEMARKFFWVISKRRGVTKAELIPR